MGGVSWAMQHGIHIHPDRYPGLSAESTFEEFQIVLHQANQERCAMPCLGAGRTRRETTTMPSSGMSAEDDVSVNASEPHAEIDATVAPVATSEEPTMHLQETSDMPMGTAEAHMEIDSDHSPVATSEEPAMHMQEASDMPTGTAEAHMEIDSAHSPVATSEEPTMLMQETADMPLA